MKHYRRLKSHSKMEKLIARIEAKRKVPGRNLKYLQRTHIIICRIYLRRFIAVHDAPAAWKNIIDAARIVHRLD